MEPFSFQGKVGVVTGGGSGIGRALAAAMRDRGMEVMIADIDAVAGPATAAELGAKFLATDVADAASVEALAKGTIDQFGRVDMLCNNAGVGPAAAIADLTLDDWQWMLGINLWGVIHGLNFFLPHLRKAERGFILNTASLSGLNALPGRGAYATAKFGVVALTEVLSKELALEGARISASVLCPGPTRTNIGTGSRHRTPGIATALHDFNLEDGKVLAANELQFLEPRDVAEHCFAAMLRGDLYIQTHPALVGHIAQRHRIIEDSFVQHPMRASS